MREENNRNDDILVTNKPNFRFSYAQAIDPQQKEKRSTHPSKAPKLFQFVLQTKQEKRKEKKKKKKGTKEKKRKRKEKK